MYRNSIVSFVKHKILNRQIMKNVIKVKINYLNLKLLFKYNNKARNYRAFML